MSNDPTESQHKNAAIIPIEDGDIDESEIIINATTKYIKLVAVENGEMTLSRFPILSGNDMLPEFGK